MQQNQKNILIVGAGPVGALAALFLRQQGHAVSVFEKREDPRQTDGRGGRSINLALANRGIAALERAGVMDRVWPLLLPMRGRMVHPKAGPSQLQPYGQADHEVIYSVSRHGLNVALIEALVETSAGEVPVRLEFGQVCQSVDLNQRRAAFAHMATGDCQQVEFDHVIGADGAGSVVRRAIIDAVGELDGPEQSMVESTMEPLGHGYKELTIPPDDQGRPALAIDALHIWPRGNHMMIALPNQDYSFTVTLFLPLAGPQGFDTLQSVASQSVFLQAEYPQALAYMPNWQADFAANPVGHLATLHCEPWYFKDRALLIGDAAHAIVPFHGQGMNCGFEDCAVLAECLSQAEGVDWSDLFAEFATLRMPSCQAIAQMAIENYEEMRASVVDPIFQLKKAVGFELQRRYPAHFTPRYGMVMFGCMPYEQALVQGQKNDAVLNTLVEGKQSLADVDWKLAARLLGVGQNQAILS